MKILLLGRSGQVGWELQRVLCMLGNLVALDRHSTTLCGNLQFREGIAETIRRVKPHIIVNAAAYTAVDHAEKNSDYAYLINSYAVEVIAKEAEKINALLVHYSTDYVFDGSGEHFRNEDEKTGPLNIYGKSKLLGEIAIEKYCTRHLIFRTSWVYGIRGNNFPKTIHRLALEKDSLSIINDQYGSPTSAELIADATMVAIQKAMADESVYGKYNLVANGVTTWFDYAQFILTVLRKHNYNIKVKTVSAISTLEFQCQAVRPLNSKLNNSKFRNTFNIVIPDWKLGVERMLDELLGFEEYRDKYESYKN